MLGSGFIREQSMVSSRSYASEFAQKVWLEEVESVSENELLTYSMK